MSTAKKQSLSPEQLAKSFDLFVPSTLIIRDNIGTFFILSILPYLVLSGIFAFQLGIKITPPTATTAEQINISSSFWWLFTAYLLYTLTAYGPLIYTFTKTAAGKAVGLREAIAKGLPYIWRLAVLSVYTSLLILGGLILLIVPGIIMLRRYYLAPYYLVDRNLSVGEAMRQSAADSKLYSKSIYGLFGVSLLIGMLGVVPFLGTYLSTIGQLLYSVAPALRYQEINSQKTR